MGSGDGRLHVQRIACKPDGREGAIPKFSEDGESTGGEGVGDVHGVETTGGVRFGILNVAADVLVYTGGHAHWSWLRLQTE